MNYGVMFYRDQWATLWFTKCAHEICKTFCQSHPDFGNQFKLEVVQQFFNWLFPEDTNFWGQVCGKRAHQICGFNIVYFLWIKWDESWMDVNDATNLRQQSQLLGRKCEIRGQNQVLRPPDQGLGMNSWQGVKGTRSMGVMYDEDISVFEGHSIGRV